MKKSTKTSGNVCCLTNCNNKSYNCKESFFRFPTDTDRAKTWVLACDQENLSFNLDNLHNSKYRLCGAHFEKKMFLNDLRNRLHIHAVPTVFPSPEGNSYVAQEHNYSHFISEVKKKMIFLHVEIPVYATVKKFAVFIL